MASAPRDLARDVVADVHHRGRAPVEREERVEVATPKASAGGTPRRPQMYPSAPGLTQPTRD